MAVAVTIIDRDVEGTRFKRTVSMAFSGTYTTGGESPTNGWLKALELPASGKVTDFNPQFGGGAAVGVGAQYDRTNNKVLLFRTDQIDDFNEELPAATSLTGITLEATVKGI